MAPTPTPGRSLRNVHQRDTAGPLTEAVRLFTTMASPQDQIWPADRWPALRLDQGLAVGSAGGHGAIRYRVIDLTPGQRVRFAMLPASPVQGWHEFTLTGLPSGAVRWRHELHAEPVTWMVRLIVPLHDALLEDLFDQAEAKMAGVALRRRVLSRRVRLLRVIIGAYSRRALARQSSAQ
jgi:hypothetical protein